MESTLYKAGKPKAMHYFERSLNNDLDNDYISPLTETLMKKKSLIRKLKQVQNDIKSRETKVETSE